MRVAETAPAACSACYLAQPELRHVDFEAAWDGPMFPDGVANADGEIADHVPVSIDDLIICEHCLCAAAAHVGMADPDQTLAELEQLRDVNQTIAEKNRGLEDYVATLEAAIKAKPQPAQRRAKAGV
jgi:hypothetical protein